MFDSVILIVHTLCFLVDFNDDDYIDESDLKRVIRRLCGEQKLSEDNIQTIIRKVRL